MKHIRTSTFALASALLLLFAVVPAAAQSELLKLEAVASYYGAEFNGKPTSSGEIFDMNAFTAAHKTLPFGTILEVTNLESGQKATVRVNDRGPFVAGRELDVSKAAAEALGMTITGTARVSIRKLAGAAAPETGSTAGEAATTAAQGNQTTAVPAENATTPYPAVTPATAPEPAASPVNPAHGASGPVWRIQMGSFSKEDNATRLAVKLRSEGFNPAFEKNGTLIRVVLTAIPEGELARIRVRLENAGYSGFLVRQESW